MPTFAKIKGLFNSTKDKHQAERKIIKGHLTNHHSNLKSLRIKHKEFVSYLLQILGNIILRILFRNIAESLRMNNLRQLKTNNKKIYHVKPKKPPLNNQVPMLNLSDFEIDTTCLKYGLHHSFISYGWYSLSDSIGLFYEQDGKRFRYPLQTEVLLSICRRQI